VNFDFFAISHVRFILRIMRLNGFYVFIGGGKRPAVLRWVIWTSVSDGIKTSYAGRLNAPFSPFVEEGADIISRQLNVSRNGALNSGEIEVSNNRFLCT
jgi:hypothetical protein